MEMEGPVVGDQRAAEEDCVMEGDAGRQAGRRRGCELQGGVISRNRKGPRRYGLSDWGRP
jgi:hypothetical protein